MITEISLENFTLFSKLAWKNHGPINVIIGKNDTGKTTLLKVLYTIVKSVEDFTKRRVLEHSAWKDVLANKLVWTFQPDEGIGQLVRHGSKRLKVSCRLSDENYEFSFSSIRKNTITNATINAIPQEGVNAIFLPPKELLTAFDAIAATRESLEIFGFDDTYYDLITSLRLPTTRGNIEGNFKSVLASMESLFSGEVAKQAGTDKFVFKRNNNVFSMSQTAEGIKKISILTTLIRNRRLNKKTILFFDEPEANLHPNYIVALMDMIFLLSAAGVQIYLATHSYFVIKQLYILAQRKNRTVTFCSLVNDGTKVTATINDLRDGMPDNPIIDEAVELYRREVELELKG